MTLKEIAEKNRKRFRLMAKEAKIRFNKDKLAAEDYKVIKCAEAVISAFVAEHPDVELPYDAVKLISKRKTIRDDINQLEEEIKEEATQ
jgi:hypothetical protein